MVMRGIGTCFAVLMFQKKTKGVEEQPEGMIWDTEQTAGQLTKAAAAALIARVPGHDARVVPELADIVLDFVCLRLRPLGDMRH
jgi:hypothetical protein